jgi:NADPH:quinone reductase-like Zn-dependent oxidoreductase
VEAVAPDVRELRVGDEVLGFCPGAFAEYACATAEQVVPKPPSLTFEEAAAIPIAATTALRAIRDVGQVQSGHRVLINGAAGGVGTYAVQIARALGAEVTGVCGTASSELVLSLGASRVIDYTTDDFTSERARYDVILDNAGSQPLGRLRHALKPGGTLVLNAGGEPGHVIGPIGSMIRAAAVNRFVGQRLCFLPTKLDRAELASITELIADGKLRSVIDRTYSLADTAEGLRYVEAGHAHGKVVVTIA